MAGMPAGLADEHAYGRVVLEQELLTIVATQPPRGELG